VRKTVAHGHRIYRGRVARQEVPDAFGYSYEVPATATSSYAEVPLTRVNGMEGNLFFSPGRRLDAHQNRFTLAETQSLRHSMEGDMTNAREELEKLMRQLEQQRDELRVKMSLAKLDAREEWNKLEKKWGELKAKTQPVREELGTTAGNVGAALRIAAEEIRDGYARLRKRL
jgi:BMFP domain-containing protein YqiC